MKFRASDANPRRHISNELASIRYSLVPTRTERFDVELNESVRTERQLQLPEFESADSAYLPVYEFSSGDSINSLSTHLAEVEAKRHYIHQRDELPPDDELKQLFRQALAESMVRSNGGLPFVCEPMERLEHSSRVQNLALRTATWTLESCARDFQETLSRISYLGPLRSAPARHYIAVGGVPDTVGIRGEYMPQMVYSREKEIMSKLDRWFKHFEIPYKLSIDHVGTEVTGEIIVLTFIDKRSNVRVSSSDIGFGIGQLLPILVEGTIADNKMICVEQPEIHLHPRMQAAIADFLISTRQKSGSNSVPNNQWIIETHSEALMLRIQRRIREGKLSPSDVSVIYVRPDKFGSSSATELRLDEQGEFIDEWPDGFFEESFYEVFNR